MSATVSGSATLEATGDRGWLGPRAATGQTAAVDEAPARVLRSGSTGTEREGQDGEAGDHEMPHVA
jgi:hypothetical protein